MIRKRVTKMFPRVVDICFVLGVLMVLALAAGAGLKDAAEGSRFSFLSFGIVFVVALLALLLTFGSIYMHLDVRDAVREIAQRGRTSGHTES